VAYVQPDDGHQLRLEGRIGAVRLDTLCGFSPRSRNIWLTAVCDIPTRFASVRVLQCVSFSGFLLVAYLVFRFQAHWLFSGLVRPIAQWRAYAEIVVPFDVKADRALLYPEGVGYLACFLAPCAQ